MNKRLTANLALLGAIAGLTGIWMKFGFAVFLICFGAFLLWLAVGLRFQAREKAAMQNQEEILKRRQELSEKVKIHRWN